jgi:hypothetical protein
MNQDNFYSIERLLEFGLSASLAGQMVASMNQALHSAGVPDAHLSSLQQSHHHYFVVMDGKPAGPFSDADLSRLMQEARIDKGSLVWRPGMSQWQELHNVPDVLRVLALTPPPLPLGS